MNNIIDVLSKGSWYVLIVMIVVVLFFVFLVLKELLAFLKTLSATEAKVEHITRRLEGMDAQVQSSLEVTNLMSLQSYNDLQFNSDIANTAFHFAVDNSDTIFNYSNKVVRGYKRYKNKRKK